MTRSAPTRDHLPTRGRAVRLDLSWLSPRDGVPQLHVGYDVFDPWKSRSARVAIGTRTVDLDEALAGAPLTRLLADHLWFVENGRMRLLYGEEAEGDAPGPL